MYILNDGRNSYLNFLRNLTPQILILTLLVISGSKLDWNKLSSDNLVGNFLFWGLVFIFTTAAWANSADFLEDAVEYLKKKKPSIDNEYKTKTIFGKMKFISRHHTWLFVQMLIALFIVEIGLVGVVIVGIGNATAFLKLFH
jgi:hypothetical protein